MLISNILLQDAEQKRLDEEMQKRRERYMYDKSLCPCHAHKT